MAGTGAGDVGGLCARTTGNFKLSRRDKKSVGLQSANCPITIDKTTMVIVMESMVARVGIWQYKHNCEYDRLDYNISTRTRIYVYVHHVNSNTPAALFTRLLTSAFVTDSRQFVLSHLEWRLHSQALFRSRNMTAVWLHFILKRIILNTTNNNKQIEKVNIY